MARSNQNSQVSEHATQRAHEIVDKAGSKAANVESQLREQAESAQETLSEKKELATEQLEETLDSVEGFIRRRPLTAAGIAFVAGALATQLMRK
jgi:ElaB/YqjD/DUF883 family membrane-anchored ribosome-binding protein